MTSVGPEPGWYFDPDGGQNERYWNGVAWTEHRRSPQLAGSNLPEIPSAESADSTLGLMPGVRQQELPVQDKTAHSEKLRRRKVPAPPVKIELQPGGRAKVVAPGDDQYGQTGTIDPTYEDDEHILLKFGRDPELYAYRRDEVVAVDGPPVGGQKPMSNKPRSQTTRPASPVPPPKSHTSPKASFAPAKQRPCRSNRWADRAAIIERLSPDSGEPWLQSIKDNGPRRIERGTARWSTGVAIAASSVVLIFSTFMEWGRGTMRDGVLTLSGVGSASIDTGNPTIDKYAVDNLAPPSVLACSSSSSA